MGTIVSAGSVALGVKMVEKHLTLRRADGGPDSAFSMEPEEIPAGVCNRKAAHQMAGGYFGIPVCTDVNCFL